MQTPVLPDPEVEFPAFPPQRFHPNWRVRGGKLCWEVLSSWLLPHPHHTQVAAEEEKAFLARGLDFTHNYFLLFVFAISYTCRPRSFR